MAGGTAPDTRTTRIDKGKELSDLDIVNKAITSAFNALPVKMAGMQASPLRPAIPGRISAIPGIHHVVGGLREDIEPAKTAGRTTFWNGRLSAENQMNPRNLRKTESIQQASKQKRWEEE